MACGLYGRSGAGSTPGAVWAMLCTAPLVLACAVVVELSLWRYGRWLRQQAESVAKRSASGKVFPGPPSGKRRSGPRAGEEAE